MGFYGIRRRKPQIERTAAGGFVAAQAGDPRSEALPRADGKHRKHEEQNRWMKTTVVIPNYNGKHFLAGLSGQPASEHSGNRRDRCG